MAALFIWTLFLTASLPATVRLLRRDALEGRKWIVIGITFLQILTLSNLPSFVGIAVYPGASFSFLPMLLLAYGVFRSDFLDLNDLLFRRVGLFYVLNAAVGVVLLVQAGAIVMLASPESYAALNWFPWLLFPLISLMALLALGILVGGTNPSNKLNQLGALSLFVTASQLIAIIGLNLRLELIVARRLEQLAFMVFCCSPAVQIRFAFAALGTRLPPVARIFDTAAVALAALSLSPWLFSGVYDYSFGRVSEVGPVVQLLAIVGFAALLVIVIEWLRVRRERPSPLGSYVVLYVSAGGVALLLNVPATLGIPLYPLGNLGVLTTAILAYGILKHGGDVMQTRALRVSRTVAATTVISMLLAVACMYPIFRGRAPVPDILFHLGLLGAPLLLLGYLFTFLLTRPITLQLDEVYASLDAERDAADRMRKETEGLNQLLKQIAMLDDIDRIMEQVISFVNRTYRLERYSLYSVDSANQQIHFLSANFPDWLSEEDRRRIRETPIDLRDPNGTFARAYKRREKLTYFPSIPPGAGTLQEQFVTSAYRIDNLLICPLIANDQLIAFLNFTTADSGALSRGQRRQLSTLCDQIAGTVRANELLRQVQKERAKSDQLLLNILPIAVAEEIKEKGHVQPVAFDSVSILFTDFVGFTRIAENMKPGELVEELDGCFSQFDAVVARNNLEKLKTIGDAYMCAGGIPKSNRTHAVDCCLAALEFQAFMRQMGEIKAALELPFWQLRIGIHTGPVTAGVIGTNKFAYDVWGDAVNTASRMESSGAPGRVNISGATYALVSDFFSFEERGKIQAKGKGEIDMYFVNGIRPELSLNGEGWIPNDLFKTKRAALASLAKEGSHPRADLNQLASREALHDGW